MRVQGKLQEAILDTKMKIPKKINMLGHEWKVKVIKDKSKDARGSFDWKTKLIIVNDKYGEKEMIFLHEIIEAILLDNFVRFYGQEGNMEYHFFFNHTKFAKIIKDIYQVLKDNKLI